MNKKTFADFWKTTTEKWLSTTVFVDNNGVKRQVADVCSFRKNYVGVLYHNYEGIKNIIKDNYFKESAHTTLSRFKRAAVFIYVIIKSDPIIYSIQDADKYFLKQRFAVYLAFSSIFIDYDKDKVAAKLNDLREKDPNVNITEIRTLGLVTDKSQDDFLTSFYKDLAFAELYNNYDVLAIANLLGLIIEKASILTDNELIKV